jgi:hypothetical protein
MVLILLETTIVEKITPPPQKDPKYKSYRIEKQLIFGFRKLRVVC